MPDTTQKLQTILFADIANSTRLYDYLGDEQARTLIALCMDILMLAAKNKKGTVIKTIGDEVMCTFAHPDHAVSAAIQMQEEVVKDDVLSAQHIQMRIGMHHGPVIEEEGDIFGDAVNLAARMVGLAKGGQIITNALTLALLGARLKSMARLVDQTRVKGKKHPVDLYELSWGQPEELTMITTVAGISGISNSSLILETRQRQFIVNQEHPVITMGRDPLNHIIISDPKVSRLHARIELRKDKFVLIDQSTNGTYVWKEGEEAMLLRREEVTLPDQGVVGLGETAFSDQALSIKFIRRDP